MFVFWPAASQELACQSHRLAGHRCKGRGLLNQGSLQVNTAVTPWNQTLSLFKGGELAARERDTASLSRRKRAASLLLSTGEISHQIRFSGDANCWFYCPVLAVSTACWCVLVLNKRCRGRRPEPLTFDTFRLTSASSVESNFYRWWKR